MSEYRCPECFLLLPSADAICPECGDSSARSSNESEIPEYRCQECFLLLPSADAICPECGDLLETEAEAAAENPICYACGATATTRCQCCNTYSCVRHVESTKIGVHRGEVHELRCKTCRESARHSLENHNIILLFVYVIAAIVVFLILRGRR